MTKKQKRNLFTSVIIFSLACISLAKPYFEKENTVKTAFNDGAKPLEVHFIDVGQGDSTLFEFPDGRVMLIDAGENEMGEIVCDYLQNEGITKIDYLVGTHPHSDHIGGLDDVIENFGVGTLYMPDIVHDSQTFLEVLDAADKNSVLTQISKRNVFVIDEENISVKFLSPVSDEYEGLNNYSSVLSVEYFGNSFLICGDAEYVVEKEISGDVFDYDVLRVGHHGSNSSSTANFLEKVRPEIAVISVGLGNSYGHPHKEVINRLKRFDAKVLRTDLNGNIVLSSDGETIKYETERENESFD